METDVTLAWAIEAFEKGVVGIKETEVLCSVLVIVECIRMCHIKCWKIKENSCLEIQNKNSQWF
jgi:hypothetical protein